MAAAVVSCKVLHRIGENGAVSVPLLWHRAGFSSKNLAPAIRKVQFAEHNHHLCARGSLPRRRSSNRRFSIVCRSGFSFNHSGEIFSENDEDYAEASVMEAVEVKSGPEGFLIKLLDGKYLKCVHNNPDGAPLLDSPPQHAIVLKLEDGSDLLLPMIVLELPSVMLMSELRHVQMARPTVYHIIKDIIGKIGYEVKRVRVTHRVHDAYFAQLYLAKLGDENQTLSFDLRPSDAINIAVRCKVPIQVNKQLAFFEGVKIIRDPAKSFSRISNSEHILTALDRPDGKPCVATEEFRLLKNMVTAALEERYADAAQWRDQLNQMRSKLDETKQF